MTELLENSDNTNADTKVSESPSNEATISLATVQALADALQKIESYTPTVWVDNESPDIDAAHLNKAEQAIMRVTTAMNSAVDVIKDLQSQVNTTNNNLSKYNFNLGDTTANNHKNIDRIATFSGGTWINKDYNADFGGQWCFVDSFLIDGNGAAIQRIMSAQTNTVLATRYCEKNVWGDWNIGVTKSDLVTRTAIALTAANSYSFNADYTYGYKRAGWVEFQFNLESAFDRSKNNVLHIPDDCVADKQIWFPVFSSSGGNVIARGMVYHTDVHIIGIDAINGAKGLFGHVVYMSKS